MKIGIIGAGNIGGNLTRRFIAVGHEVSVANSRGPATLQDLVDETGATAVSVDEVALDADVVVVTIPEKNVPLLPTGFLDGAASDVVVIDTGNYYPQQRDGVIDEIENGATESRWVSDQIGFPVVKAFNNIYAAHLLSDAKPQGAEDRRALPVAGDDERAKRVVMDLINEIGFDAVDAGGLDDSWRFEPASPAYGFVGRADALRVALSEAVHVRKPEFRA
jgi:predicted dinucleotide-binding enzyme